MQKKLSTLSRSELDRIIMMAWEDRTSFDAIKEQFGILPGEVIKLMRHELKPSSFKLWRRRTNGRITKHEANSIRRHLVARPVGFVRNRNEDNFRFP